MNAAYGVGMSRQQIFCRVVWVYVRSIASYKILSIDRFACYIAINAVHMVSCDPSHPKKHLPLDNFPLSDRFLS